MRLGGECDRSERRLDSTVKGDAVNCMERSPQWHAPGPGMGKLRRVRQFVSRVLPENPNTLIAV